MVNVEVASALRQSWRAGYGARELRADLLAGAVVGIVALPLSMALAIASGVPPQHGLATAIVAGAIIAILGGSPVQVSGPTAAFVAILAPISARFGVSGLLLATAMAGVILILMGLAGSGRLIEFVPYPVTTGFTAGIAVVIGTLQLEDFLGLHMAHRPETYLDRLLELWRALPTLHAADAVVGAFTLLVLLLFPRFSRRVPAALVALLLASLATAWAVGHWPGFEVATIKSRFGGIPRQPPLPVLPWLLPGPGGQPLLLSLDLVRTLLPSAIAIAILGAIESLLSAVVADGMTGRKHDPDAELVAQGVGNLVVPFFGGIAATGALARTATNVRAGARSPVSAVVHSLAVLAAVLALAPALGYLPMASLAALLLVVAWNMGEWPHFANLMRSAPRSDVLVLLLCFGLTIVFDMVVSVTVGMVLASFLFMKRMAEVSGVTLVGPAHGAIDPPLPRGVMLYDVAGPLFFGAAAKAMSAIASVEQRGLRVVVLDVRDVPAVDATGLVALESVIKRLNAKDVKVILAGVQPAALRVFAGAGWRNRHGRLRIFRSFDRGLALARDHANKFAAHGTGPIPRPPA